MPILFVALGVVAVLVAASAMKKKTSHKSLTGNQCCTLQVAVAKKRRDSRI
jgi:hypothetical protein